MNKYWQGFAQSIILFNVLLFSSLAAAEQIIVMSNTRKDLPIKIETTNIPNQDYIWQLEISPNQQSQQNHIKLLNPHPTQKALNNRALEIARKITLAQLPQVSNNFKDKMLNLDEENIARTAYYYGKYILFIKFPQTVQYAIKPNFSQLQSALEPFCNTLNDTSKPKLRFDSQGNIAFNAKFLVDTEGQIRNIDYVPKINYEIKVIIEPLIKKIRFYPRNITGVLKSFSIEQPIIIQCHALKNETTSIHIKPTE
ncbi:hypothetical protein [Acinetobacter bereziniae]|uniref:Uncharacterized protein n=1 Tax=Acinetobacter bereziniae NIPH 3 TaxID=1217651 RepID=N8YSY1_ACIBZ|nr:hypothetical protein [Acinetobacter bereziniae]ENV22643.1 hypothetical protein F963_01259 [Acinetobacter bereziniae NIPH 3]